jgi:hypothetical protein
LQFRFLPAVPGFNAAQAVALVVNKVAGPVDGVSTDNAIVRWDGTTGKLLQNSRAIVDDLGELTTHGPNSACTVADRATDAGTFSMYRDAHGSALWTDETGDVILFSPLGTATFPYGLRETIVTLADGITVPLDAAKGNVFALTAAGDRTILAPSNAPALGTTQKMIIRHLASGGARTLSLTTGGGGFRFGSSITALTQTVAGKIDYIGCIWHGIDSRWDVVAYTKGF